jgi:trigger factor
MKMVAQQYGPQVRSDVISETVNRASTMPFAARTFGSRVSADRAQDGGCGGERPTRVSAVFEVYPEIKLGDLSTARIVRPMAEVGPEDVQQTD